MEAFFVGEITIYYPKEGGSNRGSARSTPAAPAAMLGGMVPSMILTKLPLDLYEMLKQYGSNTRKKRSLLEPQ